MKRSRRQKTISGTLIVTAEECGNNNDKMVRRFIKKVKQEKILDEVRDRRYFKKPSVKRIEEKRRRERLIEKINSKREELFSTPVNHKRRAKK
tara:strand:- start:84 stop:362 length:279 start_codon:yes stop_codon:yes gene_type:complete